VGGNVFFNGAKPTEAEKDAVITTPEEIKVCLKETGAGWQLETNVYDYLPKSSCATISTRTLGMAFEPEGYFENPDGTPIIFNEDYFGNRQAVNPLPGPFASKTAALSILARDTAPVQSPDGRADNSALKDAFTGLLKDAVHEILT
jgi:hypothetical protein